MQWQIEPMASYPDVSGDPADWLRVDAARQLLRKAGVVA